MDSKNIDQVIIAANRTHWFVSVVMVVNVPVAQ
jgi:hypothetical protein